jgi:hypothetical protein
MAEVIDAVEGPRDSHFDMKPQMPRNEDLLLNEVSFIGVADFEQEVVKESYNQIEETPFDDDIMFDLIQDEQT